MQFRIGPLRLGMEWGSSLSSTDEPAAAAVTDTRQAQKESGNGNAVDKPTLTDFKTVNQSYLGYVEGLSRENLQARVDEISVESLRRSEDLEKAREILEEFGIVVVRSAISGDGCRTAYDAVNAFYQRYQKADQEIFEDDEALYQVGTAKLSGYYKLSHYSKPVINRRQGQDEGMVDIFNCDLACPDALREVRSVFENESVQSLINRKQIQARNLNVYINRGIEQTRGFHVDSYSENLKAFIYLTDVSSLWEGPYTFVKRSHKGTSFRTLNRYLSDDLSPSTEAPIVDPLAITPILSGRGALVISDQSGVHRGWPQMPEKERMVAVMKYSKPDANPSARAPESADENMNRHPTD